MGKEYWRPLIHFTPKTGWMNDPNGLVWFQGKYHLFFQYNPYHCDWDTMHWGHATSSDLLHWRQEECALIPDENLEQEAGGGCFSGSPAVLGDRLYLLYTASGKKNGKVVQTQCAAVSEDGVHFEKVRENPLIGEPFGNTENFRDPKVFFGEGRWRMVCGGTTGDAGDPSSRGRIYLYSSDDLLNWEYDGILLESDGSWGSMFECPDLFQAGDQWVLTASPMNHPDFWPTICFIGKIDFSSCRFAVEEVRKYDWGNRFYAPQTYLLPDGRRILMGWMNGWMWMPWMEDFGPTGRENWRGCLSLPREVFLDETGWLCQRPVKEAAKLCQPASKGRIQAEKMPWQLPLEAQEGRACCIRLKIWEEGSRQLKVILLADENGKGLELTLDLLNYSLILEKDNMGNSWDSGLACCDFKRPEDKEGTPLDVEIWIDRSSVEVFLEGGRYSMTDTVYPSEGQYRAYLQSPYKQIPVEYEICPIPR